MAGLVNTEKFKYDQLIGGSEPTALQKIITIAGSQGILAKGSVLGVITSGGTGKLVDSTASDGSEIPKYILVDDIDTTDGDVNAPVYQSGMFNREYLIFGGSDTAETHENALRDLNIYLTSEKYYEED